MEQRKALLLCIAFIFSFTTGCSMPQKNGSSASSIDPGGKNSGSSVGKPAEKNTAKPASDSQDDRPIIGSVIMNTSGEWFAEVIEGQEDAAEDLGVRLEVVSSNNEVSREYENVTTFLEEKADAIVISPISTDISAAVVDEALDAGIPVVTWNTNVNSDITSHIGVDASALGGNTGAFAADYVTKHFPDGCKLAIIGDSKYEIGTARCDGFKEQIQNLVDAGKISILEEQNAELSSESQEMTKTILQDHPDIQMIWCWNQTSLLGCAQELQKEGRNDIVLLGTDMSLELAHAMQADNIDLEAVTSQKPYDMGYQAVENAVKALRKENYEKEVLIPVVTYTKQDQASIRTYIEDHAKLEDT